MQSLIYVLNRILGDGRKYYQDLRPSHLFQMQYTYTELLILSVHSLNSVVTFSLPDIIYSIFSTSIFDIFLIHFDETPFKSFSILTYNINYQHFAKQQTLFNFDKKNNPY